MAQADADRQARIAEEAAMWLEKLERTITKDESARFRTWLKTPPHRAAIVERCKLWHGPEILAVLGELIPVETFSQRVERHYDRFVLAIFMAVSAFGLATVFIAWSRVGPVTDEHGAPLRADATFRTEVGERKTIALPDGGSIAMNAATQLLLRYTPHSRTAVLLGGEATFDAKHDPERPFVAVAGDRRFEVLSDATFNLYRVNPENTHLLVTRGHVRTPESRSNVPFSPALLRAAARTGAHTFREGEGGLLGLGWQLPTMFARGEIERRLAWHSGIVVFDNDPLEDVLAEMARHSAMRFRFDDDRLRQLRVSGRIDIDDQNAFTDFLRSHLQVSVQANAAGELVLLRSEH